MIPKHTTVLNLYVVLNLLALKLAVADVTVILQNQTKAVYYDLEAEFGPNVPHVGIRGYLVPVKPLDGCHPVEHPPGNMTNQSWIALIERNNCTFREKVFHAQMAGYAAVIVYNSDGREQLIHMGGDDNGINIPSVMVGWSDGIMLRKHFCYDCRSEKYEMNERYEIIIDDKEYYQPYIPPLLWPFAVVIGTCFVVMLCFVLFRWCRDFRKKKKSRLSANHLKKIPTKKFKKGDVYDACAICLDDYEEGDKLRLLPCSHVYHCACVDPWLTKNKRSCPVCKRKVIPRSSADSDGDSSEDDNGNSTNTASERTPLLRHARTNPSTQGSTFDHSGLPEDVRTQVRHVNEVDENDANLDLAVTTQRGRTSYWVGGEESSCSSVLSTSDEEEENVIEEVMYAEPNHGTHSESSKTEDTKKTNHVV
ncbi:hypothetical protein CHS0354_039816 [Potamilus streckersoni]|uniref:RING-type E3 ubiquitin transferase n=1 Tax=Potamilus streckersoni TaxID=2493646 RepID=A0AAE0W0I4_9BIVA|nr:hypothetical protein CHS0354_039816 [Potamilus streckersoni]